jgi:hypothetical protein
MGRLGRHRKKLSNVYRKSTNFTEEIAPVRQKTSDNEDDSESYPN